VTAAKGDKSNATENRNGEENDNRNWPGIPAGKERRGRCGHRQILIFEDQ